MSGLPTCFGRPTHRTSETCRTSETSCYTYASHGQYIFPKLDGFPTVFGRPTCRTSEPRRTSGTCITVYCLALPTVLIEDISDVRYISDVRHLGFGRPNSNGRPTSAQHKCSNGHFSLWTINTPSHPLERVDHFTLHSPKNTSAPSLSLSFTKSQIPERFLRVLVGSFTP